MEMNKEREARLRNAMHGGKMFDVLDNMSYYGGRLVEAVIKNDPNDHEEISKKTFSHSSETELDNFEDFDFFVDTTDQDMVESTMKRLLYLTK